MTLCISSLLKKPSTPPSYSFSLTKQCLPSQGRCMLMSAIKLNKKSKNKSQVLLIALFTLQRSLCCCSTLVENYTMFFSSSA